MLKSDSKKTSSNSVRVKLTERDLNVLLFVNKFGFIKKNKLAEEFEKNKDVEIYNRYIVKRFRLLEKAKYLKSIGKSYGLGIKGKKCLLERGYELEYNTNFLNKEMESISEISSCILNLDFKNKMSRIEFINSEKRKGNEISNFRIFAGVVWNKYDEKYLVYRTEEIDGNLFVRIKSDLKSSEIKNVIIITNDLKTLAEFSESTSKLVAKNIIVIPDTDLGYELIKLNRQNLFSNENIKKYIDSSQTKNKINEIENHLEFNGVLTSNSMLLNLKEIDFDISYCITRRLTKIFFMIEDCYKDYFEEIRRAGSTNSLEKNILFMNINKYKAVLNIESENI